MELLYYTKGFCSRGLLIYIQNNYEKKKKLCAKMSLFRLRKLLFKYMRVNNIRNLYYLIKYIENLYFYTIQKNIRYFSSFIKFSKTFFLKEIEKIFFKIILFSVKMSTFSKKTYLLINIHLI